MKTPNMAIYNKAVTLIQSLDSTFLELGHILRHAKEHDGLLYRELIKLPGLSRRTVFYLIEIDRVFRPLKVDKSILASVGWTKLARIAKHVTAQNVSGLLALADSLTDRELKAKLAGKIVPRKTRVVLLYLKPAQYKKYALILVKFGAKQSGKGLIEQEAALMKLIAKVNKIK